MDLAPLVLLVTGLLAAAVPIAVPILLPALGEAVVEQSGILNIGIEGLVLIGAWGAYVGAIVTHSLLGGVLLAVAAGAAFALLLALFYVTLGTDQIVTGVLANIFAVGFTSLTYFQFFPERPTLTAASSYAIPGLASLPVVGPSLFTNTGLTFVALLGVPLTWFLLRQTWFGLNVRAVGEHPAAAAVAGVNVHLIRYAALLFGGVMAALGGAALAIDDLRGFVENASDGRGFIALAVVVLGKWNPWAVFGGVALVAMADAGQFRLQASGVPIPHDLLLMLPYALAIAVLVGFAGGARYPSAVGVAYRTPH
jgi:simple sugar transport system permease protein